MVRRWELNVDVLAIESTFRSWHCHLVYGHVRCRGGFLKSITLYHNELARSRKGGRGIIVSNPMRFDSWLSHTTMQIMHSKASQAEFAKDYDQAFRLYIKTAELFLHLSRLTNTTEANKQRWKTAASKALARAELIKKFVDTSRNATNANADPMQPASQSLHLTPVAINHFSQRTDNPYIYTLR